MLWFTSLFFIPCAVRAFCHQHKKVMLLFSTLTTTSLMHHSCLFPWKWITPVDKALAHLAGVWGMIHGIHSRAWKLLPLGLWSPFAYYRIESRVPYPIADWVHASIHLTSSIAFYHLV